LLCLLLVAPLLLAACGEKEEKLETQADSEPSSSNLSVTLSDEGCNPVHLDGKAGKITFVVTNSGAAGVTEFYVYKDKSVQGEVENVTPGVKRTLTLTLEAGEYTTKCPNGTKAETGTLTVT
jgi:iron uptake system component EfeO